MRELLETKEEKIHFIINHLEKMKGLEFIDKDEISSCNLAIRRLRNSLPKKEIK
jgi:hypothetical protein